jgi:hypothetical protein
MVNRFRHCQYVPPMAESDARRLRGLPAGSEQAVAESGIDGLKRRADALALALVQHGRRREADELRRRVSLLERADELHHHASDLETLAGLYRALAVLAHERDPALEGSLPWAQVGALEDNASPTGHGAAFRETAILRNRALRWVAAALAKYAVQGDPPTRAASPRA